MGDMASAIGAGIGVFVTCLFGFFVLPKIRKRLKEWEPFKKKEK